MSLIPYEFNYISCCVCCNSVFNYDARTVKYKPKTCEPCKLKNRKLADRAHMKKRQTDAESCGFESRKMGKHLKELTIRSHREVGEILGITSEASRTAERSALAKIRKAFKMQLLNKQLENSLR